MLLFSILFLSSVSLFPRELLVGLVPAMSQNMNYFLLPIELSVGFFTIGSGLSQLIAGGLGDSLNKKKILMLGAFFIILGNILFFFSTNSLIFLLTRVIVGFGAGIFTVLARALAADNYEGQKLLKVMSWISMSTTFFPLIAPILGALILIYFGLPCEFIFLIIMGIFSAICIKKISLPRIKKYKENNKNLFILIFKNIFGFLNEKDCIAPIIISSLFFGCGIAYLTVSTQILHNHYGINTDLLGYFYWPIPIGYLIGTLLASRFFSLFKNNVGYFILIIANLLMLGVVASFNASLILFEIFIFFFFLASGIFTPFLNKLSISVKGKTAAASSILGFSRTFLSFMYAFVANLLSENFFQILGMFVISFILVMFVFLKYINANKFSNA